MAGVVHPQCFKPINALTLHLHKSVALSIALILVIGAGAFIYQRRDRLFGRDPDVVNDTPVVRHNRLEEIVFVWRGLTFAILSVLYQLWFG